MIQPANIAVDTPASAGRRILRLKRREERRLRGGHVWIYSNEVDNDATPLSQFEAGEPVVVEDSGGTALGSAYVNPHTLICARLVSRDARQTLGEALIARRLEAALALRERLFPTACYRLAYGESDFLPGLVIDRYQDTVVVQVTTAGMERVKDAIVAAINRVIAPRAVILRNDSGTRATEGLPSYVETVLGDPPDTVLVEENAAQFEVSPASGQKTGWFFDQRMNRARLGVYTRTGRVLDLFSYVGACGIQAALAGAGSVLCADSSASAVDAIKANATRNGVTDRVTALRSDAFELLRQLRADREHFNVVVVDPPAFIKRRKDIREGTLAYRRINQMAMQVLAPDGMLVACSCSYHLQRDSLRELLLAGSRHLDRNLQIIEEGLQAPDHPVHPAIPETAYLKCLFTRVLPTGL